MNEEEKIKLNYLHVATANEIIDLGNNQWLLKPLDNNRVCIRLFLTLKWDESHRYHLNEPMTNLNITKTKTIWHYVPPDRMQKVYTAPVSYSCKKKKKITPESDRTSKSDYQFRRRMCMGEHVKWEHNQQNPEC